jgi:hypothetical protein
MFCPICKAEYKVGITHCNDCDADLVVSLPERAVNEDEVTFIPILSTYNLGDIAVLRSILDGQGIEYFIQGENTAYIRGYMDPSILKVREDQVQTVKELLQNFDLKFTMFNVKNS